MSSTRQPASSPDGRRRPKQTGLGFIAAGVTLAAAILVLSLPHGAAPLAAEKSKPAGKTDSKAEGKKDSPVGESPFRQETKLPAGILDGGKAWLNAAGPISVRDLKGKIVIIDFWTYCCINCMHILPELKAIEKKYPNEVVVIGVHSAKFANEKESDNIRQAIQRYEIEHPVVNDSDMTIWDKFGTSSWPTVLIIDPEGYLVARARGEVERDALDNAVEQLIAYHRKKGTLDETPVKFNQESAKLKPTPLRFPGKVLADEAGGRLFISDSNHNRIVICTPAGNLLDVIGNGTIGGADGGFAQASFNRPQGTCLVGDALYVADTENHLIRVVDLKKKSVATLVGTGKQARSRVMNGKLRESALSSPWALAHLDGILYIAMAGPHQIWRHKLGSQTIDVFAGSGREDIIDGPLADSAFAQPSDIVADGKSLYVVDSEGSSIRKLDPAGEVSTVVGTANLPYNRLFAFGDVDGSPPAVRFQHPIGLAYYEGDLLVADSYNHKIRKVVLAGKPGETSTVLGNGKLGDGLNPPQLSEPEGLSVANSKLYIADTNNHRIGVLELKTKKYDVLEIEGLTPPALVATEEVAAKFSDKAQIFPAQTLADGDTLQFSVALSLPEGFKLNKLAPLTYRVIAEENQKLIAAEVLRKRHNATVDGANVSVAVPLAGRTGKATVELSLTYGYCRDGVGGLCKVKTDRWRIPVELKAGATDKVIKLSSNATK